MDTREILRPYKKQRLSFEGVLIDITKPNRRSGNNFGLVFGSVYAPNEKIELDHVVIQMDQKDFNKAKLNLFTRYRFTAMIYPYYKFANIMGVPAQQENFMIRDISLNKLEEITESKIVQPTMFVKNRVENATLYKSDVNFTMDDVLDVALRLPNDGSIEQFINNFTKSCRTVKVAKHEMENILYT